MTRRNHFTANAPSRSFALWPGMRVRGTGIVVLAIGGDPAGAGPSRKI